MSLFWILKDFCLLVFILFPLFRLLHVFRWITIVIAALVECCGCRSSWVFSLGSDISMAIIWIMVFLVDGRKAANVAEMEIYMAAQAKTKRVDR